jgi:hypothetical protein
MKLYEFFGNINQDSDRDDTANPDTLKKEEETELTDNVFWFILDDNDLHKKYFMPTAKALKQKLDDKTDSDEHDWKVWLPMVNVGCVKFYKETDVQGDPKEVFDIKMRKELCKRLTDHYHQDIVKDEYNLGSK